MVRIIVSLYIHAHFLFFLGFNLDSIELPRSFQNTQGELQNFSEHMIVKTFAAL